MGSRGRMAAAAAAALLAGLAAPAEAAAQRVLLLVLPVAEARLVLQRHGAALGLGVNLPSPAGSQFVAQVGGDGSLRPALEAAGVDVALGLADNAPADLREALVRAFDPAGDARPLVGAVRAAVAAVVLSGSEQAEDLIARSRARAILIGVGARTPALVADLSLHGVLAGGPRPGVVTPADVAVTILHEAGAAPPDGTGGRVLEAEPVSEPLSALDRLAGRFEREAATRAPLTVAMAALAGSLAIAAIGWARGARAWPSRLVTAVAFGALGYVGALFVDVEDAWVRALPLVLCAAAGLWVPPRYLRRGAGIALVAVSGVIAVLAVLAALHPAGEPALSLWGSPLRRLFGLDPALAGLMGGGMLAGAGLLRWPPPATLAGAGVAAGVAAVPRAGANIPAAVGIALSAAVVVALGEVFRKRGS